MPDTVDLGWGPEFIFLISKHIMLMLYYTNHTSVKRGDLWEIQLHGCLLEMSFLLIKNIIILCCFAEIHSIPQVEDRTEKGVSIPCLICTSKEEFIPEFEIMENFRESIHDILAVQKRLLKHSLVFSKVY